MLRRIARWVSLVLIFTSPVTSSSVFQCDAQKKLVEPDYDFRSLAVASVKNSAAEAAKITDVPQRVKLLITAARILPTAEHVQAIGLLDLALSDLKAWNSGDMANLSQREKVQDLAGDVLAAYAKLDPERASALRKKYQDDLESEISNADVTSLKSKNWSGQFSQQRAITDQTVKFALALVDTDPDRASGFVVQSLQSGTVSGILAAVIETLNRAGKRTSLNKLEIRVGEALAARSTLDPMSLACAGTLLDLDKDMPPVARSAIINFFMNSLQSWATLVRDASTDGGLDASYLELSFTVLTTSVKPALLQYASEQLPVFDSAMNQLGPLAPQGTRSSLEAFQPEKLSDPWDELHDIQSDPNPKKRDLRLVRLVAKLLRNEIGDADKNLDLAADAISVFSNDDAKSAFEDLLTITRVDRLAKRKKFIEAKRLVGSISSEETKAWALLALSSVAAPAEPLIGFELTDDALTVLDKASPSPHKVQLALMATAMLTKSNPQLAFEILSAACRYANSSTAKVDKPLSQPFAFGLEASIGNSHTKLGVFPARLSEVKIDPAISILATTDWFRVNGIADAIREPSIRLQLKLQFAQAVLEHEPKRPNE